MPVLVFKAFTCLEGDLVAESAKGGADVRRRGFVLGVLTSMSANPREDGPTWSVEMAIGKGAASRTIMLPIERFLSADEYQRSFEAPLSFRSLATNPTGPGGASQSHSDCVWLYRDVLYVTERAPRPSENEEVVLRIKALHFQDDQALKRLREQVANFEAIGRAREDSKGRQPIPDDVKLLVWARDGGACVRCGSTVDLHFDHIIALTRGGGDHAENIQLLCRSCNLAKGNRLI